MEPLVHHCRRESPKLVVNSIKTKPYSLNYYFNTRLRKPQQALYNGARGLCYFRHSSSSSFSRASFAVKASSASTAFIDTSDSTDVLFSQTFPLQRTEKVSTFRFIFYFNVCVRACVCMACRRRIDLTWINGKIGELFNKALFVAFVRIDLVQLLNVGVIFENAQKFNALMCYTTLVNSSSTSINCYYILKRI